MAFAANQVWTGTNESGSIELSVFISNLPELASKNMKLKVLIAEDDTRGLLDCTQIDNPDEYLECFYVNSVLGDTFFNTYKTGQLKTKSSSEAWVVDLEHSLGALSGRKPDLITLRLASDEVRDTAKNQVAEMLKGR